MNKNIIHGIIMAAIYVAAISGALAVMAWISSAMDLGGFDTYLNTQYAIGLTIGLAIAFVCGYAFDTLLSRSVTKQTNEDPDMPKDLLNKICRYKLLSQYSGYTSILSFVAATLIFVFTGEAYIQALCILMPIGFISLFFCLQLRFQGRQLMRKHFRNRDLYSWG